MALNLAKAADLKVFDALPGRAEQITGATPVAGLDEIAAAGHVLLSLPGPREVRAVVDDLLPRMRPGSILVNLSTVSSELIREIGREAEDRSVDVLDAPVTGAPEGADAGTLTIMVGGDAKVLERARPLLEPLSRKVLHAGVIGAGTGAKLLVNMLYFTHVVALADALTLGVKAGITTEMLGELMPNSNATSWVAENVLDDILAGDRGQESKFTIALCLKDLDLITRFADEFGCPVPLTREVEERYAEAGAAAGMEAGEFAVVSISERSAGTDIPVPVVR
jgi:3-hydroxyisobutyrate dehydrogenase-like beta-hydroxyacid dehydrogenase